jgi:hypothetical protein
MVSPQDTKRYLRAGALATIVGALMWIMYLLLKNFDKTAANKFGIWLIGLTFVFFGTAIVLVVSLLLKISCKKGQTQGSEA